MRLPGFTGRLAWLVQAMLFLAGLTYFLHATVHSWPTAVFMGGFIAAGGTGMRMIYLTRMRKDRAARWPLLTAAAGVLAAIFLMSRHPQPLLITGYVDIAAAVAAWGAYLVIRALAGKAAKPASAKREDTPA